VFYIWEDFDMGKKITGVSAEVFVQTVLEVHSAGGNWDDVAKRVGTKKTSCTVRASNLKKEGVNLPTLSRSGRGRKKDIVALAKMVSDFQASQAVNSVAEVAEVAEVAPVAEVAEVLPVVEQTDTQVAE